MKKKQQRKSNLESHSLGIKWSQGRTEVGCGCQHPLLVPVPAVQAAFSSHSSGHSSLLPPESAGARLLQARGSAEQQSLSQQQAEASRARPGRGSRLLSPPGSVALGSVPTRRLPSPATPAKARGRPSAGARLRIVPPSGRARGWAGLFIQRLARLSGSSLRCPSYSLPVRR